MHFHPTYRARSRDPEIEDPTATHQHTGTVPGNKGAPGGALPLIQCSAPLADRIDAEQIPPLSDAVTVPIDVLQMIFAALFALLHRLGPQVVKAIILLNEITIRAPIAAILNDTAMPNISTGSRRGEQTKRKCRTVEALLRKLLHKQQIWIEWHNQNAG